MFHAGRPERVQSSVPERGESRLSVPIHHEFDSQEIIHLFQGALIRLRVECSNNRKGEGIDSPEVLENFLPSFLEYDGQPEKHLSSDSA